VADPVEGPSLCTSTITIGISLPMAKEICSLQRLRPGPEVAVITFIPAIDAPRQYPIDAISSSAWRHIPPTGGRSLSRVFKIVVAGVMGYPAKNRHPAVSAPQPIASLPAKRLKAIPIPPFQI
jgi:hypothetical protein